MPEGKSKFNYKMWVDPVKKDEGYPDKYKFHLVNDLFTLNELLSKPCNVMGFDTETTGLDHENIFMVGYSFCSDGINSYYVPVKHFTGGLGEPAIKMIYEKLTKVPVVFMFNMRYDVRVLEFHGFKEAMEAIDNSEYDAETKQKLKNRVLEKQYMNYDMSKVNIIDVQAMVFLVDTNKKYPSLKGSEEYFLGWKGDTFEETVMNAQNENAVTFKKDRKTGEKKIANLNFYYLTPEEAYKYAATDALGTLLLGLKLMPFLKQAKKSGELDVKCLQPLTRFENEMTVIDTEKLKAYSENLSEQIEGCQRRCWDMAGEEFNLGSPVDNNRVLTNLNIHTGVTTSRGMSTSKEAIQQCLSTLSKDDPARQLLKDLVDYASLSKQRSSYVDNVIEMCDNSKNHPNRLRFAYKNTEVPSGRFAAGGDKKNSFFSNLNIQNITKPHVTMHYVVRAEELEKYHPEIIEKINDSGSREECDTDLVYSDEELSQLQRFTGEVKAQEIINKIKDF